MAELSNGIATAEPCCPTCGYLLVGLPEFRCPECGTSFDAEYLENAAARSYLLPWERPETGGRIRRLSRTILHATLHPGRFFTAVGQRKDRPIARAGSLVAACVLASLFFHAVGLVLRTVVFFFYLWWLGGSAIQARRSAVHVLRLTASSDWMMSAILVLTMLVAVFLIAVFLARVFRRRSGALRVMSFASILSPAVASGAFILAFAMVFAMIAGDYAMALFALAVCGHFAVLLLLVWHCCRRVLVLGRGKTAITVVVCGVVQLGAVWTVNSIEFLILLSTVL